MSVQMEFDFEAAVAVASPISSARSRGAVGYQAGLSAELRIAQDYERRGYAMPDYEAPAHAILL